MIKTVLWDWNGTLLDDVDFSVEILNDILRRENLPTDLSVHDYRQIFGFPVSAYYEKVGLGGDKFEAAASAWMTGYIAGEIKCGLFDDAVETLDLFKSKNINQVVLSAHIQEDLTRRVEEMNVLPYMQDVIGLNTAYATSKVDNGKQWLKNAGADPATVVMIGDTAHDAEVAAAIGCRCVLVARGHQSMERLLACGCPVAKSLKQATQWVLDM